jgi:hypothetical protein
MSQIRAAVQNQCRFLLFARTFLTRLGAVSSDLRPNGGANEKGKAMITRTMKNAVALGAGFALGVAGAVVIATASPSWAAPVLSNTAAVRTAASSEVTDVHYYRRGYHRHGYYGRGYHRHGYYGRGYYGRGYYGGGYYGRGYGYPYGGNPYPYPSGYGWGGW